MEQKVTEIDLALDSLGNQVKMLTIQNSLKDARIMVLESRVKELEEPEDEEDLDKGDL